MANWNEIMNEIKQQQSLGTSLDIVRRKYIKELNVLTGRNVICYYSGFLSNSNHPDVAINDNDMTGFMTAINKLDKNKGLDLIMHSPGGEVTATEAIGNYLREVFGNDIRVIVPQLAMSGGTMLTCIGKKIIMGKHSNIGPVDPQIGGTPCYGIIQEFEKAKNEIIIIDNYAGRKLFDIIKDIKVNIKVYTQNIDDIAKEKYELQYNNLTIITTDIFHDRFIMIDKKILYHCGASFKDLGKKCFCISVIKDEQIIKDLIIRLGGIVDE